MLITEIVQIEGRDFTHNYSDAGFYIKQDGTDILYDAAYDPAELGRTYTETEELIPEYDPIPEDDTEFYAEIGRMMLGGEVNE